MVIRKLKKSSCGWCGKIFYAFTIESARRKTFNHIKIYHQDKEIGLLKNKREK